MGYQPFKGIPAKRSVKATQEDWAPLCSLLETIPYLKSFTWQGLVHPRQSGADQPPTCLVNAIKTHHPRAHLHVENWSRIKADEDCNNEAELALATSLNLRSIQARLSTVVDELDFSRAALKRLFSLAPNLESVDLSESSSGYLDVDLNTETMIRQRERSRFFAVGESPNRSLKSVKFRGSNFLETFEDVIDLSKLEQLDVDYLHDLIFFRNDGPLEKCKTLKELSVVFPDFVYTGADERRDYLRNFLSFCKPLEHLSLTNRRGWIPLPTILENNGRALRSLVLHEIESPNVDEKRDILSPSQITEIGQLCPLLEDLTIDIDHASSAKFKEEVFHELGQFPLLSILRIYLDLGIANEAARTPWVFLDEEEARAEAASHCTNPLNSYKEYRLLETIWSVMKREKSESGAAPLKELHVKVGEWERERGGGYPAGWVIWEASHRRYYIAKARERDDRPNEMSVLTVGEPMVEEFRQLQSDVRL